MALDGRSLLSPEERRLYDRLPVQVSYIRHPCFSTDGAEQRLFGPDANVEVPTWTFYGDGAEPASHNARKRTFLSRQDEATLFLRLNYARCRLSRLRRQSGDSPTGAEAKEMVMWHRRALEARSALVEANMGLVLAMAKRAQMGSVEFAELISEGNMALLRSVEKFDVSRGYKFSTYACRAVLKSFCRLAAKHGRYRQHFPTEFDPELERSDYDVRKHEIQEEASLDALREILARNRAKLTEIEQRIVWERFAIHGDGKKRTLSQVGRIVGLSNERVRQIQCLALRKLRLLLDEQLPPS